MQMLEDLCFLKREAINLVQSSGKAPHLLHKHFVGISKITHANLHVWFFVYFFSFYSSSCSRFLACQKYHFLFYLAGLFTGPEGSYENIQAHPLFYGH